MSEKRDGKWIGLLRPDMPLPDAARHVLFLRLRVVADYLPRALEPANRDPENIHQLRVGTRRAAAAVRIFRSCLPEKTFKRVRQRLRALRQAAGCARDWDVFLEGLKTLEASRPADEKPGFDFLLGYAFGQRAAAQKELAAVGEKDGRDFERFLVETVAAIPDFGQRESAGSLFRLARPLLTNLLHCLEKLLAGNLNDLPHLHQIRIAGKRLRYAMEVFGDCYEPAFKETLYPQVQEMQEILGAVNDCSVATNRLEKIRGEVTHHPLLDWARLMPGIDDLLRDRQEGLPREKERFFAWLDNWRLCGATALFNGICQTAKVVAGGTES